MNKFALRRFLLLIPTIWLSLTILFLLLRVVPGDVVASQFDDLGSSPDEQAAYQAMKHQMGLDRSLAVQYVSWAGELARGNLGVSLRDGHSIADEVGRRLTVTLELSILAIIISWGLGIPLGVLAAFKQDSFFDYGLRAVIGFIQAVPAFWLAVLVLVAGVRYFDYSPPVGYHPIWQGFSANFKQMIGPALIVGIGPIAGHARLTRSTLLEVLRQDFIRTANAKGLGTSAVLWRHALRNSLIPVVTSIGLSLATVISGSVIMEQIFTIPGMGLYLIDGVRQHDYNVVVSVTALFLILLVFMNLLVDLSYSWLDPRIRYT